MYLYVSYRARKGEHIPRECVIQYVGVSKPLEQKRDSLTPLGFGMIHLRVTPRCKAPSVSPNRIKNFVRSVSHRAYEIGEYVP